MKNRAILALYLMSLAFAIGAPSIAELYPAPKYHGPPDTPEALRVIDALSRYNHEGRPYLAELQELAREAVRTRSMALSAAMIYGAPHGLIKEIRAQQPDDDYVDRVVLVLLRAPGEIWGEFEGTKGMGYSGPYRVSAFASFCLPTSQRIGAANDIKANIEALEYRETRLAVARRLEAYIASKAGARTGTPMVASGSDSSGKASQGAGSKGGRGSVAVAREDQARKWIWPVATGGGVAVLFALWMRARSRKLAQKSRSN